MSLKTTKKTKQKKPARHQLLQRIAHHSKSLRVLALAAIISYALFGIALWVFLKQPPSYAAKVLSSQSVQGKHIFQPSPGYRYMTLDVRVTQNTGKDMWFTPVTQSYITDQSGDRYEMAPYELSNPFDAHSYHSGEIAEGQLSYQVGAQAKGLKWCYEFHDQTPLCTKLP